MGLHFSIAVEKYLYYLRTIFFNLLMDWKAITVKLIIKQNKENLVLINNSKLSQETEKYQNSLRKILTHSSNLRSFEVFSTFGSLYTLPDIELKNFNLKSKHHRHISETPHVSLDSQVRRLQEQWHPSKLWWCVTLL